MNRRISTMKENRKKEGKVIIDNYNWNKQEQTSIYIELIYNHIPMRILYFENWFNFDISFKIV